MTHEVLKKISSAAIQVKEAEEAYKKTLKSAIEPALEYIAKEIGDQVGLITLIGYTPGFNDGDPCTHSSDWGIGYGWLSNYGLEDVLEDLVEYDPEDDKDIEEKIDELMEKSLKDAPKEIEDFVSHVLDPYYEEKLETDYIVYIFFKDGTYSIKEDEYDCGY